MRFIISAAILASGTLATSGPVQAQPASGAGQPRQGGGGPPRPSTPGPKPYKDVITEAAKSDKGVFTVHRIEDKVYWEIPASMLGRDFLWSTEIAQLPAGAGYGGTFAGSRVVKFTKRNHSIFLRGVNHSVRAEKGEAIQRAVADATLQPILQSFTIEAYGENEAAVIDVTRLFTTDPTEFSVRSRLGATGVDSARSYIDRVKAFEKNIETRSLLTFSGGTGGPTGPFGAQDEDDKLEWYQRPSPRPTPSPAPAPAPFPRRTGPQVQSGAMSATIHYSLVLLPEKPMMGRLFDSRVGFFSEEFQEYGKDRHRAEDLKYIARYRLEKKDPNAAVSDPVKPIVYYLSREVPEKWRPYMKKGVEDWRVAFEKAGFSNAIECREAPSEKDDPNWDPENVSFSVIRWAPTATENAMGPHVSDPRSGEILSAHSIFWHNVTKLAENWYWAQCAPLDPRAKKLPLPEELVGELLRYITAHEIGHTLGLQHNFKASSSFTIAQLRSKEFTDKWGNEASIMDYGRFNYVAQPGDNANLIPKIGPYDLFAIEWGYKPIPNAKNPDDEKETLDRIAARQVTDPTLRFGNDKSEDPSQQTEDLGSDPIEATRLGLKNIDRAAGMLLGATVGFGENYERLAEMHGHLLGQRTRELGHVTRLVGGVVETDYHGGRGREVWAPVPAAKQREAVRFLAANALKPPKALLDPKVLYRIESSGVADRVANSQRAIVATLLSESRAKRMLDTEILNPGKAYSVAELVGDVQGAVWAGMSTADVYQRNLHRAYLNIVDDRINGDSASTSDLRPLLKGAIQTLAKQIDKAIPLAKDRLTALHLADCRKMIERILDPR